MKKSVNGIMVELNNMQQVLVNKSISIFDENFNTGKTVKGGLISEGTYFYFWSHPQKDVPNHFSRVPNKRTGRLLENGKKSHLFALIRNYTFINF